jgi:hypothetical protein
MARLFQLAEKSRADQELKAKEVRRLLVCFTSEKSATARRDVKVWCVRVCVHRGGRERDVDYDATWAGKAAAAAAAVTN